MPHTLGGAGGGQVARGVSNKISGRVSKRFPLARRG